METQQLVERGVELLDKLTEVINSYDEMQKVDQLPKTILLENKFFSIFETNKELIEEMQKSTDSEVLRLYNEVELKRAQFQILADVYADNQNLVEFDDVQDYQGNLQEPRATRPRSGLFTDFLYSLSITIVFCLLFAFIWSQYLKTH